VAAKMEELVRGKLARGDYDKITAPPEFTGALTADFQSVSHDRHLQLRALPPDAPELQPSATPEELRKRFVAQLRGDNFGFEKVEHLAGNVGYLDLRGFMDAQVAGPTAVAAMNFLGNCDALIIDLRQNGGGEPSMIQLLCSYLFDEPTHLNDFYTRASNDTTQFWTYASVPGPRLSKVPVWVLTSAFTFSGAEEFAYDLKNLKRGTIVGETTGGGAHPVDRVIFPSLRVVMNLPFGTAVNPITKTSWEGTGVEPDIKVPADSALSVAHIEALKKLRDTAGDSESRQQIAWALEGIDVRAHPVAMDAKSLRAFTGGYGPRRIREENGVLYYQRPPQPEHRLIPGSGDLFLVDGVEYFRIRFERTGGKVTKLVGLYENGMVDENPRNSE